MMSCFLQICRIFLCCEDEENEKERHEFKGRSCYGSYHSPPQQKENLLVPSWKASSSPHSSPSAASSSSYLSSSLAESLSKPWSPSFSAVSSFASPSPAKAHSDRVASAGAKTSPLTKPSSSSLVSSKAFSSASSSSSSSSTHLIASFAPPSPGKAQPPHAASAGAKASRLSEPSSPSLVSSKASSLSSSSFTPPSTASFARPSPVKAQPPHAASSLVSSNAAASSSSSLTPSTAPFASPSPVKARSTHALSASGSPAKASSLSSSSLAPSTAPFASPQFNQRNKMGQLPRYEIPKHLQEQIRNDVVPKVLRRPLSPSTYADYFAALLYAEDYYYEKWSNFLLRDVTLELRKKDSFKIQNSVEAKKSNNSTAHMDKPFVAFKIDLVPEKRPYLLSRDHVLVRPVGKQIEPFQGILFRVEKSKWVVAEFSDDFYKQHSPLKKYDVSFSFNRVCLKRSHHAVSAAMDPFLCSILFPDPPHKAFLGPIHDSDFTQNDRKSDVLTIIRQILRLKSPQPYLLEGPPLSLVPGGDLSGMGKLIQIAIFRLYETCSNNRILVCAPRNLTLDELTKGLLTKGIPESRIFRANAAFRDFDRVPDDIMPTCLFEGECFTCPPLAELKSFRVVTSTFISSYRLYAAGIGADHFTHIFLVDASSSTEPETIVAFANLVGKTTTIVVTGSAWMSPAWVRSDIARQNGLKRSLFQRLLEMEPYSLHDPMCIAHI